MKKPISQRAFKIFNTLFLLFLCAMVIIPLLKVLSDSLINNTVYGIRMFDEMPDLIAYKHLNSDIVRHRLGVSLLTAFGITFLGMIFTSVSAYILIQRDMPGVKIFKWLLVLTLFFDAGFNRVCLWSGEWDF